MDKIYCSLLNELELKKTLSTDMTNHLMKNKFKHFHNPENLFNHIVIYKSFSSSSDICERVVVLGKTIGNFFNVSCVDRCKTFSCKLNDLFPMIDKFIVLPPLIHAFYVDSNSLIKNSKCQKFEVKITDNIKGIWKVQVLKECEKVFKDTAIKSDVKDDFLNLEKGSIMHLKPQHIEESRVVYCFFKDIKEYALVGNIVNEIKQDMRDLNRLYLNNIQISQEAIYMRNDHVFRVLIEKINVSKITVHFIDSAKHGIVDIEYLYKSKPNYRFDIVATFPCWLSEDIYPSNMEEIVGSYVGYNEPKKCYIFKKSKSKNNYLNTNGNAYKNVSNCTSDNEPRNGNIPYQLANEREQPYPQTESNFSNKTYLCKHSMNRNMCLCLLSSTYSFIKYNKNLQPGIIVNAQNATNVFISPYSFYKSFNWNYFERALIKSYNKATVVCRDNLKIKYCVLAEFIINSEKKVYRAAISDILEKGVEICLFDYGYSVLVNYNSIREAPDYTKFGFVMSFHCNLNSKLVKNNIPWDNHALPINTLIQFEIISACDDEKSCEVKIYHEGMCLNDKLIREGYFTQCPPNDIENTYSIADSTEDVNFSKTVSFDQSMYLNQSNTIDSINFHDQIDNAPLNNLTHSKSTEQIDEIELIDFSESENCVDLIDLNIPSIDLSYNMGNSSDIMDLAENFKRKVFTADESNQNRIIDNFVTTENVLFQDVAQYTSGIENVDFDLQKEPNCDVKFYSNVDFDCSFDEPSTEDLCNSLPLLEMSDPEKLFIMKDSTIDDIYVTVKDVYLKNNIMVKEAISHFDQGKLRRLPKNVRVGYIYMMKLNETFHRVRVLNMNIKVRDIDNGDVYLVELALLYYLPKELMLPVHAFSAVLLGLCMDNIKLDSVNEYIQDKLIEKEFKSMLYYDNVIELFHDDDVNAVHYLNQFVKY
ncbi:hypothetical protein A3Q56_05968 [Intoshia linei]|uniref:Tudor domain-containing protein n=1 Tax=Intoshia linei TaxID=1819745 RepID=A0A177AWF0_9BILA|nr:hypothetical protein A3Q56_05968 [Intoshia linei]